MKRAIIVHCWGGYPEYCWYPDVKRGLERLGFEVTIPAMPETDSPNLGKWLPKLKEVIGKPDRDTYLIGHSIGCATIMRYLESLTLGQEVGGTVFVAGFTDGLNATKYPEIQNFFTTPIDYKKIRSHCSKFVAIQSDNDPYVPLKQADILKKEFGAEIIVKHNAKHFSGAADGEESCLKLTNVISAVRKMSE